MRLFLVYCALVTSLTFTPRAAEADEPASLSFDGDVRTQLLLALGHYHEAPTQTQLESLGLSDVPGALMEIAADPAVLSLRRTHAVSSLGYYPSSRVQRFIEAQIVKESKSSNTLMLGRLLQLASVELGVHDPEWARELLEPFAEHDNPAIREHVERGLAALASEPGFRVSPEGPLR